MRAFRGPLFSPVSSPSLRVRWRAALMVWEYQRPHPGRSYGRGVSLEDTADNFAIGEHVIVVIVPLAGRARDRCALEDSLRALIIALLPCFFTTLAPGGIE